MLVTRKTIHLLEILETIQGQPVVTLARTGRGLPLLAPERH